MNFMPSAQHSAALFFMLHGLDIPSLVFFCFTLLLVSFSSQLKGLPFNFGLILLAFLVRQDFVYLCILQLIKKSRIDLLIFHLIRFLSSFYPNSYTQHQQDTSSK